MNEKSKIRFLFKSVKSSILLIPIESMKDRILTSVIAVTYTNFASHPATAVYELPNHIFKNRAISNVNSNAPPNIYN